MKSKVEQLSIAEELFAEAFKVPREPRSNEYKRGVIAALIYCIAGVKVLKKCSFKLGTVEFDAFGVGFDGGHRIWRAYIERLQDAPQNPVKSIKRCYRQIVKFVTQ